MRGRRSDDKFQRPPVIDFHMQDKENALPLARAGIAGPSRRWIVMFLDPDRRWAIISSSTMLGSAWKLVVDEKSRLESCPKIHKHPRYTSPP
jgi:hypothetical protein